jgi:sugar phosphate isomerase/epimerase
VPWVRIEDDYLTNKKASGLSPLARLLDVCGIIYSARELRDGHLTVDEVRVVAALVHIKRWESAAAELVDVKRWMCEPGGYLIHDYLEYQPSRDKVLAEREAARQRKQAARAKRSNGVTHDVQPDGQPESRRLPATPVPGPGPGPG